MMTEMLSWVICPAFSATVISLRMRSISASVRAPANAVDVEMAAASVVMASVFRMGLFRGSGLRRARIGPGPGVLSVAVHGT